MFKIFSELLLHKRIRFESGNIKFFEKNVVIFPAEYMQLLQVELSKGKNERMIYDMAKINGKSWFKNLYNYYKISPEDIFRWGVNTLSVAGWGETEIVKLDSKNKVVIFKVTNSVIAEGYGRTDHCVDHFIRGSFAGGISVLFGEECDAIETKCIAKGDSYCEFYVKPTADFDKKSDIVKVQI